MIGADADTRGSTAWLEAKADTARDTGYAALADLLDARAAARGDRVDELAQLKSDVEDVQSTDCAA